MTLLSVAEAQARLLALVTPLPVEHVPAVEALGRWVAEPVVARRTQPAFDLSAMDGYAIAHAAMPGPWRVVREIAAGDLPGNSIGPGEATRIFTGAPLPPGTDSVLVQEEAARDGDQLILSGEGPTPRGNVRPRGGDFSEGRLLLAPGTLLTPARIALAVSGGHGDIAVRRRPMVALISTGNELVPPGAPVSGAQLPSSNAPMLAAMLRHRADVIDGGIVPDDLGTQTRAFAEALETADILVTTGGASVGDHDLVRPALLAAGAEIDFWKVAIRPGKPLMAGRRGDALIVGLPGNPVSAAVTAQIFLLPLLAALGGAVDPLPRPRRATLAGPLPAVGNRADYHRAGRADPDGVAPISSHDSAGLFAFAQADLLIVRPAGSPAASAGDVVEVIDLA